MEEFEGEEVNKAVNVDEIISKNAGKYKTIEVVKQIEPEIDLGNLLLSDINLIDRKNFRQV